MDFIANGAAFGSVGQKLMACGMNINALRPWEEDGKSFLNMNGVSVPTMNATLRKDEWIHYDKAVIEAVQSRLVGIGDLERRGLVYNLGNGLGKTVLEYEDASDITDADMSMDGARRGKSDAVEFDMKYLPLPITHKDFSINARVLAASRTTGDSLDTFMARLAGLKVADRMENTLFNGFTIGGVNYTFGGGTIYGYTNHPNRNTHTLSAAWNASGVTGATILADVLSMKQILIADGFYGPYVLYVPTAYETLLDEDFKANGDKSIRQRLLEIGSLSEVKVSDKLSANNVILANMGAETVRVVNGMDVAPVEWQSEGGMIHHFKVMGIKVPQIRATQDGKCGICHGAA